MSPDFPLISLAGDELSALADMAAGIWSVCYLDIISEEQISYMLEKMYAPSRVREEIEAGEVVYHWIEVSGLRVGFFAFGPKTGSIGDVWFLHKLYVLSEHQGQGGGRAAFECILGKLGREGGRRLRLRVNRDNHQAIRAYEKYGFRRIGEVCSDIGAGFVMDDFVMECMVPRDD